MVRMKIRETIVVEGRHDQARLESILEANIVVTHGNRISQKTLLHLKECHQKEGIIIFTDPDHPGKTLRTKILSVIPDAKQAFLSAKDARHNHKVGIEHASTDVLLEALSHVSTPVDTLSDLSMKDLVELELMGLPDSSTKRNALALKLHLEEGNAKHFLKQCCHFGYTRKDLETHV